MTPHGGARPGAGRPRLADEPTVEATISLPTSLAEKASRLGEGNRSEGIRRALEAFAEIAPDEENRPVLAGIDLDGTILNYGGQAAGDVRVNHAFIARLHADGVEAVAIISNQGGINFHDIAPTTYPSAAQVARRIEAACVALDAAGVNIASVDIAIFHPRAASDVMAKSAAALREELLSLQYPVSVWENASSRKPSGTALELAGIAVYYGDSDEDAAAALAAGARFVRVERFQTFTCSTVRPAQPL